MREIVLKVMSVVMLAVFGEILLPDGNMKKYAACLLSVIVCMSMASALGGNISFDMPEIQSGFNGETDDTFTAAVMADYKERAEAEIIKNCGAKPEITLGEDGTITHVLFFGKPYNTAFLTDRMGVLENEIEFAAE